MRTPSTDSELYHWWQRAVDGLNLERHDGEPQCGYYRMRERAGGPWVPVEIICDREIDENGDLASDERIVAILPDGRRQPAEWHWLRVRPISRSAFDDLVRMRSEDPRMLATMADLDLSQKPVRLR